MSAYEADISVLGESFFPLIASESFLQFWTDVPISQAPHYTYDETPSE